MNLSVAIFENCLRWSATDVLKSYEDPAGMFYLSLCSELHSSCVESYFEWLHLPPSILLFEDTLVVCHCCLEVMKTQQEWSLLLIAFILCWVLLWMIAIATIKYLVWRKLQHPFQRALSMYYIFSIQQIIFYMYLKGK